MANKSFGKLLPGTIDIPTSSKLDQFKQLVQARWTNGLWKYQPKFTVTHGPAKGDWDSGNYYDIAHTRDMYTNKSSDGLKVSAENGSYHEMNVILYGNSRFMPAKVWNGFGFETYHKQISGSGAHNIYVKRYAAVFCHRTQKDNYRYYGWTSGHGDRPTGDYRFDSIHSGNSNVSEIRSWGDDWLFEGLVVTFANNNANKKTKSECTIYNLKIGHKYSTVGGQYRYLPLAIRRYVERDKHPINGSRNAAFTDPFTYYPPGAN